MFAMCRYLVQGTLYPDVIESCPPPGSGQKHSHTIKSHHNVGGLPKDLKFTLIEPLRELFKARLLGRLLGPAWYQQGGQAYGPPEVNDWPAGLLLLHSAPQCQIVEVMLVNACKVWLLFLSSAQHRLK